MELNKKIVFQRIFFHPNSIIYHKWLEVVLRSLLYRTLFYFLLRPQTKLFSFRSTASVSGAQLLNI